MAEVIVRFTDDVYRLLQKDGYFIASGIILQKKEEVKDAIIASGLEIIETVQMEDWVSITAQKKN